MGEAIYGKAWLSYAAGVLEMQVRDETAHPNRRWAADNAHMRVRTKLDVWLPGMIHHVSDSISQVCVRVRDKDKQKELTCPANAPCLVLDVVV